MSTHGDMPEWLDERTEAECVDIYHQLALKWRWAGTFFTRADAEFDWRQSADHVHVDPMPDDVWVRVRATWQWRSGITEILCERGMELVGEAVAAAVEQGEGDAP